MTYSGFVQAGLQIGLNSILVKPKRGLFNIITGDNTSLDDIIANATIEENHHDELEITEHPVEQGAPISDHAFKRPAEVTLHIAWSNSPNKDNGLISAGVGALAANSPAFRTISNAAGIISEAITVGNLVQASLNGAAVNQMADIYAKLLKLQGTKALFDLYTGKRVYQNMMCKILTTPTDYKTENSLFITMVCRQIIITSTQTVQLPKADQADPSATASPINKGVSAAIPAAPIPLPAPAGQTSAGTW